MSKLRNKCQPRNRCQFCNEKEATHEIQEVEFVEDKLCGPRASSRTFIVCGECLILKARPMYVRKIKKVKPVSPQKPKWPEVVEYYEGDVAPRRKRRKDKYTQK